MKGWHRLVMATAGVLGISAVAVTYILIVPASDDTTMVANVAIVAAALTTIASVLFAALLEE